MITTPMKKERGAMSSFSERADAGWPTRSFLLRSWAFLLLVSTASATEYLSYSTAGHAKAQGVALSIDHPAGWIGKDNARPGVIHEFRDPASGGRDALIIVVPTPQPRRLTAETFRESFQSEDAPKRLMPTAHHRKKEFVEGLEFPCVAFDYDLGIPSLTPAVAQVRNYVLLVGNKMVQIQFYGVAPPSVDLRLDRQEMMDHVIRNLKLLKPEPVK